jgi:hypothetical protein
MAMPNNSMRKINLTKELLLNGLVIGVLSIGLVSCGQGTSGNGGTPTQPSPPPQPSIAPFSTYLYSDTSNVDVPTITVYIDGQPVTLLADTGASGVLVNSSAVSIPRSDFTSYSFSGQFADGSTFSGTVASATVCINPSNTTTCVVMPIGVKFAGTSFTSSGEVQGDFGLDSGLNSIVIGYNGYFSSTTGYSYPTYLAQQYGMNSYTLSFYPLSNTFYANVSATTPIGEITFGVYNGNSNTLIPYAMGLFIGLPVTTGIFASATSSYTDSVIFDTGSNFNFFSTSMLQTEIPNFSQSADEGACANYGWPSNIVNGGIVLSYTLQNYNQNYSSTFTTEPSLSFCQKNPIPNIIIGNTIDYGSGVFGTEDFGLPEMLKHTFTWVLGNDGFVHYIGINP